ncbi:hypothetical protein HanIR_Chr01g0047361 [Helianthus annuus]|nr:hypothetical protein HanIR_Chr01g0047361 [Helianthus annuus]
MASKLLLLGLLVNLFMLIVPHASILKRWMPAVEQAARRWWFLRVSQSILMKASYLGCLIADLKHYCIHPDPGMVNRVKTSCSDYLLGI